MPLSSFCKAIIIRNENEVLKVTTSLREKKIARDSTVQTHQKEIPNPPPFPFIFPFCYLHSLPPSSFCKAIIIRKTSENEVLKVTTSLREKNFARDSPVQTHQKKFSTRPPFHLYSLFVICIYFRH